MKIATSFKDYQIIATGNGYKLEDWAGKILLRPDPQVIWNNNINFEKLAKIDAVYQRSESKSGNWQKNSKLPQQWIIKWKDFSFYVQLMNFKHTGLFPEQAVNWKLLSEIIKNSQAQLKVLNLFAYTGAMSVVCASSGAKVTHVDAAKSMIEFAKQNARLNGVDSIRFILDDCIKFVQKEIRRNNKYDIIIMDPPSFGRGPNAELWKLEDNLYDFMLLVGRLLSDNAKLVLINSYTTGLQPSVMQNMLNLTMPQGKCESYEICMPTKQSGVLLPCGCTAIKYFGS